MCTTTPNSALETGMGPCAKVLTDSAPQTASFALFERRNDRNAPPIKLNCHIPPQAPLRALHFDWPYEGATDMCPLAETISHITE